MKYPAREAREAAGFTAQAAAKRLGISVPYLLQLERTGFPFHQAERAARLYRAPLSAFMRPRKVSSPPSPGGKSGRGKGQRVRCRPSARPEQIDTPAAA